MRSHERNDSQESSVSNGAFWALVCGVLFLVYFVWGVL